MHIKLKFIGQCLVRGATHCESVGWGFKVPGKRDMLLEMGGVTRAEERHASEPT